MQGLVALVLLALLHVQYAGKRKQSVTFYLFALKLSDEYLLFHFAFLLICSFPVSSLVWLGAFHLILYYLLSALLHSSDRSLPAAAEVTFCNLIPQTSNAVLSISGKFPFRHCVLPKAGWIRSLIVSFHFAHCWVILSPSPLSLFDLLGWGITFDWIQIGYGGPHASTMSIPICMIIATKDHRLFIFDINLASLNSACVCLCGWRSLHPLYLLSLFFVYITYVCLRREE